MDTDLVKVLYDLGGTMSALLFCFGLVIFLLKSQERGHCRWQEQDREHDLVLQNLIKDSIETAAKLTESHTLLVEVLRRMEARLERLK